MGALNPKSDLFMLYSAANAEYGKVTIFNLLQAALESGTALSLTPDAASGKLIIGVDATKFASSSSSIIASGLAVGGGTLDTSRNIDVPIATESDVAAGVSMTTAVTPATLASRQATETQTGFIELATQAEVDAGVATSKAVTPATLASRQATKTQTGLVELATQAEVDAGSDDVKAVTPLTFSLASRPSTEVKAGFIELATQTEVNAGVDPSRAVTPLTLENHAWTRTNFVGTGSLPVMTP